MGWIPKSARARRRLIVFLIAAPVLAAAVALSLYALRGTVVYFYTPAQLDAAHVPAGRTIRLGGLVKPGSIAKAPDGTVTFVVQDKLEATTVSYKGDLPDLFREGQGVVCEGVLQASGALKATQVLAKHDEKYIPKNVEKALKEQGEWRPGSGMDQSAAPLRPFS
ncbi:cytochrome c maturation protein CcmE [Asticcacaulis sp. EMRT-3]|uniref:cytochrome c maturation protein CcmE n=1 Tax=Asticcacaulis sp. EMRT-3 TaxID=3040349 RepID=UPI0024AF8F6C|nr:cytochrome c maturation protein CcmE [Asticcacaulis sp. EMRT-3]MDI7775368.1 cytochrome c maturation protein CcmE [Asticcacaulis sp. EMRT-3]